jgi:hypothetical protein
MAISNIAIDSSSKTVSFSRVPDIKKFSRLPHSTLLWLGGRGYFGAFSVLDPPYGFDSSHTFAKARMCGAPGSAGISYHIAILRHVIEDRRLVPDAAAGGGLVPNSDNSPGTRFSNGAQVSTAFPICRSERQKP